LGGFSGLALYGDGNYGFGAASTHAQDFIQAKFDGGAFNIFIGLADGGVHGNSGAKSSTGKKYVFPAFYLGGGYATDLFSVDLGFIGDVNGYTPHNDKTHFSMMVNLRGKVNLDPISIGANVALYVKPAFVPYLAAVGGFDPTTPTPGVYGGLINDLGLEALLDFGVVGVLPCDIGLSVGLLANLGENFGGDDWDLNFGMGIKAGLSATFDIGGFKIIPGLIFTSVGNGTKVPTTAPKFIKGSNSLALGLSFQYAF